MNGSHNTRIDGVRALLKTCIQLGLDVKRIRVGEVELVLDESGSNVNEINPNDIRAVFPDVDIPRLLESDDDAR